MKKRIFAVLLIFAMLVPMLAACNTSKPEDKGNGGSNGGTDDNTPPAVSEGLAFELNSDESGYIVVGIGTCTDTEIVIPSTNEEKPVTGIGDRAFLQCNHLTSVTIPDGVTSIGESAFWYCGALTSITIPDSVTSIGETAFGFCRSLASITIPNSTTSIGEQALMSCSGLTSITVKSENPVYHSAGNCLIETASKTLLAGCVNSVIPADGSVTSISRSAFDGCNRLESITIPDGVTSIGSNAFGYCGLTNVTLPDSIEVIDFSAFEGCHSLKSINIPDGVTSIGSNAFTGCGFTSFTVGNGVTSIESLAFQHCFDLASITIGNGVTSIGNSVFRGCTSLTTVYYVGTASDWSKITIGASNEELASATIYFYRESPLASGNWWHYDENGNPVAW